MFKYSLFHSDVRPVLAAPEGGVGEEGPSQSAPHLLRGPQSRHDEGAEAAGRVPGHGADGGAVQEHRAPHVLQGDEGEGRGSGRR